MAKYVLARVIALLIALLKSSSPVDDTRLNRHALKSARARSTRLCVLRSARARVTALSYDSLSAGWLLPIVLRVCLMRLSCLMQLGRWEGPGWVGMSRGVAVLRAAFLLQGTLPSQCS